MSRDKIWASALVKVVNNMTSSQHFNIYRAIIVLLLLNLFCRNSVVSQSKVEYATIGAKQMCSF